MVLFRLRGVDTIGKRKKALIEVGSTETIETTLGGTTDWCSIRRMKNVQFQKMTPSKMVLWPFEKVIEGALQEKKLF